MLHRSLYWERRRQAPISPSTGPGTPPEREERSDAFDRYVTALVREEQAAHGYRRVVEQTHA